jgi:hypothetical protein
MAAETVDAVTPKCADSLDVALQRWRPLAQGDAYAATHAAGISERLKARCISALAERDQARATVAGGQTPA